MITLSNQGEKEGLCDSQVVVHHCRKPEQEHGGQNYAGMLLTGSLHLLPSPLALGDLPRDLSNTVYPAIFSHLSGCSKTLRKAQMGEMRDSNTNGVWRKL